MDVLHNLALGFEVALTWQNLMFCAIGCTVGTLVGLLPGLGPLATISILLPLTYSIPTGGALIMLAGIYYGAQYGDSVSAITMKIPHASSIVACIDGYQMTLKGQTGLALFTAGVSSFIGGSVAIVVLSFLAPALGEVAFLFGPADYCTLMLLGFVCVSLVTTGTRAKEEHATCGLLACAADAFCTQLSVFLDRPLAEEAALRGLRPCSRPAEVAPGIGAIDFVRDFHRSTGRCRADDGRTSDRVDDLMLRQLHCPRIKDFPKRPLGQCRTAAETRDQYPADELLPRNLESSRANPRRIAGLRRSSLRAGRVSCTRSGPNPEA